FSLIVVALFITALVYGVVAIIVKMDDVGLHLAKKPSTEKLGWLVNTFFSAVLGLVAGTIAFWALYPLLHRKSTENLDESTASAAANGSSGRTQ
ncbi:DUF808 family protein, partial [Brevibacterium paucivorans]